MKWSIKAIILMATGMLLPSFTMASGLADSINGMHGVLDQLYDDMMPLCSQLLGVAQGIAGFAATWYIASRVWKHIANAEPIDFYPLFRPFVLGFAIMIFPSVLAMINGVMKPTVTGTAALVENSNKAIAVLEQRRMEALVNSEAWKMYVGPTGHGDRDRWYKYTHDGADPSGEGFFESIGNDLKFNMDRLSFSLGVLVKHFMNTVLTVLFEAAALIVDTMRTFHLIVLSIIGPFAFGISVFDGFQHTLNAWVARYINIFLWLPVANIFGGIIGKIQEKMIELDISQVAEQGNTLFGDTDIAYLIFMLIGIVGYTTVPSIANSIVHIGGGSALTQKVSNMAGTVTNSTFSTVSKGAEGIGHSVGGAMGNQSGAPTTGFLGDRIKG